ncbi:MAG: MFS transporter [Pseudomonas sp.]|uniref:MFS transporter n=1 Tax=Pseudomonas sp. TaxID=306 RepID=UPI003D6F9FC8
MTTSYQSAIQISDGPVVTATSERVPFRIVAATVAGNALEFFDFLTYAFFAIYIAKAFFPASSPLASLLMTLAVFGVGFITRPIGGFLIGAFADRAGRKPAMLLTIMLITIGTMGLALTPSYDSIGIAAPIIIVVCRLVQGFALGGEVGPSTAYLIEIAPTKKRGLYGSWQFASQGIGVLLAGTIGLLLTVSLSPEQMQNWGWRVPFVFGLLLIPIALYLRQHMPETLTQPDSNRLEDDAKIKITRYVKPITIALMILMGTTVATYVTNYMTTYAITTLKLPPAIGMAATVTQGLMLLIFALLGGWLSDRYGRKPVMLWPRVILVLSIYPAFWLLINYTSLLNLLWVTALMAAMTAISGAAIFSAIPEIFPSRVRALGMSIAYAVSVTVFGGATQFIVTWLISVTGDAATPAWYVMGATIISTFALLYISETNGKELKR